MKNFFSNDRFRILLIFLIGLAGIGVLALKLYFEQVRRSDDYRARISRQSLRRIRIPARRGKIFTADLQVLADNSAGCSILFYPEEMRRPGKRSNTVDYIAQAAEVVSRALNRPNPLSREDINRHLNVRPGLPIVVFSSLSVREAAPALERVRSFDGVGLEDDEVRRYPGGSLAFHLIGYTRGDNPRAAEDRGDFFYYVPDQVGRSGLEKEFDSWPYRQPEGVLGLRGIPGFSVAQVDNQGFIRNTRIAYREPVDGNHLVLSIDSRAQKAAEKVLSGRRGALVLLNADTGEVLAMASAPTADLQRFSPVLSSEYYDSLRKNPALPLWNRAINGTYMPGSILKILVSLAVLKDGVSPWAPVDCTGRVAIGNSGINCSNRSGDGEVDLVRALEKSCNSYFIVRGCETGMAAISEMLERAGVGRRTGLELNDSTGVLPSDAYKRKYYHTGWTKFDTGLLSIGQGLILITPLRAAVYTAAFANGGRIMKPSLVKKLVNKHGETIWARTPEVASELDVPGEHLDLVRQGMFQVVNSPTGTGRRAKNLAITLYGKTGSAEVGPRDNRRKNTFFVAFGRRDGINYSIAVLVEEGVSGGSSCAPLVAEFFEDYLGIPTPVSPPAPVPASIPAPSPGDAPAVSG